MTIKRKALIAEVRLNKNNARNCLRNIRCKSPSLHEGDWVPSSQRQEAVTLLVSASELLHEVKTYTTDDPATMEEVRAELAVQKRLISVIRRCHKINC